MTDTRKINVKHLGPEEEIKEDASNLKVEIEKVLGTPHFIVLMLDPKECELSRVRKDFEMEAILGKVTPAQLLMGGNALMNMSAKINPEGALKTLMELMEGGLTMKI